VTEQPQGTRRIYRLDDHGIETVQNYIAQVWGDAVSRFRLMAENTHAHAGDDVRSNRAGPTGTSTPRLEPGGVRRRSGQK
jgi:hypothetical protein